MPASERKPWPRPAVHEHVLGEVKRVVLRRYPVSVLMIYEASVTRDAIPGELPIVRGRLLGDMDGIYCTICKRPVADWHVSEDALDALLSLVTSPVEG